jgi:hypothetical protein
MKRLYNFIFALFFTHITFAQTNNFFLVNLAIGEKSSINLNQNANIKNLLYSKLISTCNDVDGVIIDKYSDYYLLCDIYASQSNTSSAGFMPVGNYKMNLKIKLIYKNEGKSFKELNYSKEYSVNSESEAIQLLINDFSFSDSALNDFFIEGSKKMTSFFSQNCNSVIESAKKYQSTGEPEKALALCLSIPSDVPCSMNIFGLTKELYTTLSYKTDYNIFLSAQDFVSKGNYENAFSKLSEISIYSKFYTQSLELSNQINSFIFKQKELQKKIEVAESEQKLKESEIELQQKRNELQQSINQTNIEIANQKNQSDQQIAFQRGDNLRQMKSLELKSQERKEMIKTAENLLKSYINRPQPQRNTNFYIIK